MSINRPFSRRGLLSRTALIAGTAASAPLLSACTAGPGSASSNGSAVTLTMMFGAQDLSKKQIAAFEADNPDIKIRFVENDPTRLNSMLASGSPPDIVIGPAVGSSNNNARGLATDLTPYLAKSKVLREEDLQPVNDSFRWDGKTIGKGPRYGIVKDWSQDATLWYHTGLFDKAKVKHLSETDPLSYDELLRTAQKLTVKRGSKTLTFGLGLEWAWSIYAPMAMMVTQQGEQLFNADLTEIDFTTDAARSAFRWYIEFARSGVGPTSLNPLPDAADLSTFSAGRMAITQDGYWFGANFTDNAKMRDEIRMAPAPVMGDKRVSPWYGGQGAWIPEKAKYKDQAWKLMEYFMAGEPAKTRAQSGWGLPGLKSLLPELPKKHAYQKQAFDVAQAELPHAAPIPESPYVSTDACHVAIQRGINRVLKKEQGIDSACAGITADINKLLKQGKEQVG